MSGKKMDDEIKNNVKKRLCKIPLCDAKGNVLGYRTEYTNGLTLFAQKREAALNAQQEKVDVTYSRNFGKRRV